MRVRLVKPIVVQNHPGVQPGDVFDVEHNEGIHLIGWGYVVEVTYTESRMNEIQSREPAIENRDFTPAQEQETQPRKSSRRTPAK